MRPLLLALGLAASATIPQAAAAEKPLVATFGFPGAQSCGTWTASRTNPAANDLRDEILEGWVMGFVTGHNFYNESASMTGYGVSPDALFAWVDNYCAANPLENIITAAAELVKALKAQD